MMDPNKIFDVISYPFKKLSQGLSLLVDTVLPKATQKFVADKKDLIYGVAIFTTVATIVVAPAIFPPLFAGTMVFNLIAGYCEKNTLKRKNAAQGAEPAKTADASNTSAAQETSFKPNALSPDFKSALTNASPEAANSNAAPADQTSTPKRADNRTP
jgi:hypothetical protein